MAKTVLSNLYFIRNKRNKISIRIKVTLYETYIRSILAYTSVPLAHHTALINLYNLQVQNHFTVAG